MTMVRERSISQLQRGYLEVKEAVLKEGTIKIMRGQLGDPHGDRELECYLLSPKEYDRLVKGAVKGTAAPAGIEAATSTKAFPCRVCGDPTTESLVSGGKVLPVHTDCQAELGSAL
jgi:hypothetical protein